jgi:hypothetical protein
MEAEKSEDQVTLITQTIGLPQQSLDLIVDTFHSAVVDPVFPPRKNAAFVAEQGYPAVGARLLKVEHLLC